MGVGPKGWSKRNKIRDPENFPDFFLFFFGRLTFGFFRTPRFWYRILGATSRRIKESTIQLIISFCISFFFLVARNSGPNIFGLFLDHLEKPYDETQNIAYDLLAYTMAANCQAPNTYWILSHADLVLTLGSDNLQRWLIFKMGQDNFGGPSWITTRISSFLTLRDDHFQNWPIWTQARSLWVAHLEYKHTFLIFDARERPSSKLAYLKVG